MRINQFTLNDLEQHIKALIAEFPNLQDDEDLRRDMLEGETNLNAVMSRLLDLSMEAKAMAEAVTSMIEKKVDRRDRLKKRAEFYRALMHRLLEAADIKSIDLPAGKVSVSNLPPSVVVNDPDALPDLYIRVKREPDKAALKEALKRGETIPGASLSNGGTTIQVR